RPRPDEPPGADGPAGLPVGPGPKPGPVPAGDDELVEAERLRAGMGADEGVLYGEADPRGGRWGGGVDPGEGVVWRRGGGREGGGPARRRKPESSPPKRRGDGTGRPSHIHR